MHLKQESITNWMILEDFKGCWLQIQSHDGWNDLYILRAELVTSAWIPAGRRRLSVFSLQSYSSKSRLHCCVCNPPPARVHTCSTQTVMNEAQWSRRSREASGVSAPTAPRLVLLLNWRACVFGGAQEWWRPACRGGAPLEHWAPAVPLGDLCGYVILLQSSWREAITASILLLHLQLPPVLRPAAPFMVCSDSPITSACSPRGLSCVFWRLRLE